MTRAQRNKKARAAANIKEENAQRLAKKLAKSIGQVPSLIREMEREEASRTVEKAYKEELKARTENNPETAKAVKIGRNRFEEGAKPLPKKAHSSLRAAQVAGGEGIIGENDFLEKF